MTIATYSDLQNAISDYLARADVNPRVPDFITLAEARLDRALRAYENQKSSILTLATAAVATPADYQEWISCRWIGVRTLDLCYTEPDSPEWRFRFRPNGDPQMFAIIAGNIEVKPAASAVGTVKFYYYFKLSSVALSVGNTSNWLLVKCPDLYLHTALAEAQLYLKDENRAAELLALAKSDADATSITADVSKFKLDPSRQADTGAGTSRASAASPPQAA